MTLKLKQNIYDREIRILWFADAKAPILSAEKSPPAAETGKKKEDMDTEAEKIVVNKLQTYNVKVSNLPDALQNVLQLNLTTFVKTSIARYDKDGIEGFNSTEFKDFQTEMNNAVEEILNQYTESVGKAEEEKKKKEEELKSYEEEMKDIESKTENTENIGDLAEFRLGDMKDINTVFAKAEEMTKRQGAIQKASENINTKHKELTEAVKAFNDEKSGGSILGLGGTVGGSVVGAVVLSSTAAVGGAIGITAYLLKKGYDYFAKSDEREQKTKKLQDKVEEIKKSFNEQKDKIQHDIGVIEKNGDVLNNAPEKLREDAKKKIKEEKDRIASAKQVNLEKTGGEAGKLEELKKSKEALQENLKILREQKTALEERKKQAEETGKKVEITKENLEQQNSQLELAIKQINDPNNEKQKTLQEKLEANKKKLGELGKAGEQTEKAKEETGTKTESLETAGTTIADHLASNLDPSIEAIEGSIAALSEESSQFKDVDKQLDGQFENFNKGIEDLDTEMAKTVINVNLNNAIILSGIETTIADVDKIKVESAGLWESTVGAVGTTISKFFHGWTEDPLPSWGGIGDFLNGVASGIGHLGEGIGMMIAHPIEVVKGISTLIPLYNGVTGKWLDYKGSWEAWKQMGRMMFAVDTFEENTLKGIGEAVFNIGLTFVTLGGIDAIKTTAHAVRSATALTTLQKVGLGAYVGIREVLKIAAKPFVYAGKLMKGAVYDLPKALVDFFRMSRAERIGADIAYSASKIKTVTDQIRAFKDAAENAKIVEALKSGNTALLKSPKDVLAYMRYEKMIAQRGLLQTRMVTLAGKESAAKAAEAAEKAGRAGAIAGAETATASHGRLVNFFIKIGRKGIELPGALKRNAFAFIRKTTNGGYEIVKDMIKGLKKLKYADRKAFINLVKTHYVTVAGTAAGIVIANELADYLGVSKAEAAEHKGHKEDEDDDDDNDEDESEDEEAIDPSLAELPETFPQLEGEGILKGLVEGKEEKNDLPEVPKLIAMLKEDIKQFKFSEILTNDLFKETRTDADPHYVALFQTKNVEMLRKYPRNSNLKLKTLHDQKERTFKINPLTKKWDISTKELTAPEVVDLQKEYDKAGGGPGSAQGEVPQTPQAVEKPQEQLTVNDFNALMEGAKRDDKPSIDRLHGMFVKGSKIDFSSPPHLASLAEDKMEWSYMFQTATLYVTPNGENKAVELTRQKDKKDIPHYIKDRAIQTVNNGDSFCIAKPANFEEPKKPTEKEKQKEDGKKEEKDKKKDKKDKIKEQKPQEKPQEKLPELEKSKKFQQNITTRLDGIPHFIGNKNSLIEKFSRTRIAYDETVREKNSNAIFLHWNNMLEMEKDVIDAEHNFLTDEDNLEAYKKDIGGVKNIKSGAQGEPIEIKLDWKGVGDDNPSIYIKRSADPARRTFDLAVSCTYLYEGEEGKKVKLRSFPEVESINDLLDSIKHIKTVHDKAKEKGKLSSGNEYNSDKSQTADEREEKALDFKIDGINLSETGKTIMVDLAKPTVSKQGKEADEQNVTIEGSKEQLRKRINESLEKAKKENKPQEIPIYSQTGRSRTNYEFKIAINPDGTAILMDATNDKDKNYKLPDKLVSPTDPNLFDELEAFGRQITEKLNDKASNILNDKIGISQDAWDFMKNKNYFALQNYVRNMLRNRDSSDQEQKLGIIHLKGNAEETQTQFKSGEMSEYKKFADGLVRAVETKNIPVYPTDSVADVFMKAIRVVDEWNF